MQAQRRTNEQQREYMQLEHAVMVMMAQQPAEPIWDDVRSIRVYDPAEHLAAMDALLGAGYTVIEDDGIQISYVD